MMMHVTLIICNAEKCQLSMLCDPDVYFFLWYGFPGIDLFLNEQGLVAQCISKLQSL